jgi:2-polyprenyl-3-methyl-5-hydroxy-6-metoxy-1,4-benzoquinol methylase
MAPVENYIEVNKELWNERTKHHLNSAFYDMEGFKAGNTSLKDIELGLLGDIAGKSVLHLQCHFGQDTLSLSRMGAKATGVDLSDEAIATAQQLASEMNLDASFICCNIYDLPSHLDERFDIVFTTYGTIGWLPDLKPWASLIDRYLKPGGQFIFAEFHPAVWMFDNDFTYVQYSYFNREAIIEIEQGTYGDKDAPIQLESVGWNHSIDEVLQNLIDAGLQIRTFKEYDYSPYNCLNKMVEIVPGKWQIEGMEGKLPLVYALKAIK